MQFIPACISFINNKQLTENISKFYSPPAIFVHKNINRQLQFFVLFYLRIVIREGVIAVATIIFVGLVLSGLLLVLILPSPRNIKTELTHYEVRHINDQEWNKISEKTVMERLVDSFDPVTPIISKMLMGEEIIVSQEIYRAINC
jgi:hypothetical protein